MRTKPISDMHPHVEEKIATIIDDLYPCTKDHNYLTANGLRGAIINKYVGDELIEGNKLAGAVAVRIKDIEGVIRNFLFLSNRGTAFQGNLLIPGAQTSGCFARIGDPTSTILIVEDYRCGLALNLATGFGVAVVLYEANLALVVPALRKKYAESQLVICAGDYCDEMPQTSVDNANNIGVKVGAFVAIPPKGISNFYQLFKKDGVEKVLAAVNDATEAEEVSQLTAENDEPIVTSSPYVWSSKVNGEALIADIVILIERYVSLPPGAAVALALWIIFTYTTGVARIAPILAILSPVRHCGKTTLLGIVKRLVFRPLATSNITTAVLFRTVHEWSPTLLIDEADTHLFKSEEMTGIFNSGHTRDAAYVYRMDSGKTPKRFNTFGAKVLAMIGKLPETMMDRSIAIHQQRKTTDEIKKKLSPTSEVETSAVRARIARFARDNMDAIASADFDAPDLGNDRATDNWEPLFAIAQVIGPLCYAKATESALLLSLKHAQISCTGEDLLRDIKAVFDAKNVKRLPTFHLIAALCEDDEWPWSTFTRNSPISPTELASLLGAFHIKSKNLRHESKGVIKGYELAQFEDAFSRYVKPVSE